MDDDIQRFLQEDLNEPGDITSQALFTNQQAQAIIIAKQDCILAGQDIAEEIFSHSNVSYQSQHRNRDPITTGTIIAKLSGPIISLLSLERLALNFLGHMSGIATATRELVDLCKPHNPTIQIAATRKTIPGIRKYQKKAVEIGGGIRHREGLYDAILIKDNHLKFFNTIEEAVTKIREKYQDHPIEIEVENMENALSAAHLHVSTIMLDNQTPEQTKILAQKIREIDPRITIESSGNITKENIASYAPYVDRISLGCLTHSVKNCDFSMEIL